MWIRTRRDQLRSEQDPGFALGIAVTEAIGLAGGVGAKMALHAIAELDDGSFGWHAKEWGDSIDAELPEWIAKVGNARRLRAMSLCKPCDGEVIMIEVDQPAFGPHVLATYIDDRRDGMAKHLALIQSLDAIELAPLETPDERGRRAKRRPMDVELACARVRNALTQTDRTIDVPISDEYAELRALALSRVRDGLPLVLLR